MTHLSLFSGVGGLDLAAEWAGFETVGQCEWADYPTKVLEKHWPDVPRWRDIKTLGGDSFYESTGLRTVDIISGGFPCQPFSVAGKRRGKEDDRYLWPEMLRVIAELRPRWVIGENVAGIVRMALDQVLSDLESIGYTAGAFIIPACAVDAPHRRDRCAIVAYSGGAGFGGARDIRDIRGLQIGEAGQGEADKPCKPSQISADVAVPSSNRLENERAEQQTTRITGSGEAISYPDNGSRAVRRERELSAVESLGSSGGDNRGGAPEHVPGERRTAQPGLGGVVDGISHWLDEPLDVPRIANGIKDRVNRLKCLGNAVVPQQFYPIFRAIAEIEGGTRK